MKKSHYLRGPQEEAMCRIWKQERRPRIITPHAPNLWCSFLSRSNLYEFLSWKACFKVSHLLFTLLKFLFISNWYIFLVKKNNKIILKTYSNNSSFQLHPSPPHSQEATTFSPCSCFCRHLNSMPILLFLYFSFLDTTTNFLLWSLRIWHNICSHYCFFWMLLGSSPYSWCSGWGFMVYVCVCVFVWLCIDSLCLETLYFGSEKLSINIFRSLLVALLFLSRHFFFIVDSITYF